ncbi:MAG TPA: RNA methyltransferase [Candidatus Peribacteraceae bacterium]|nr:RNA methyltransferase [Candidatus Peribacteraceae bacterium]
MDRKIVLLVYNIRSLWNVGSLFRTADAFAVEKIYLTGYTAVPPRREISKTALGAEEWIPWEKHDDPLTVIRTLKDDGYRIVALEQTAESVDLQKYQPPKRLCLVLGHEVLGVSKALLEAADDILMIPMHGQKESLNVAVAAGIALYQIRSAV